MFGPTLKPIDESESSPEKYFFRPGRGRPGISNALLILIIFISIIPQLYKFTLPTPELFSGFISDDAFYYYKTAINMASGHGFTFDGENETNGFHPLWMGICVAAALITQDPDHYLVLMLAINLFFTGIFTAVAYRMFEGELGTYFAIFLALMMNWIQRSAIVYFSGLETPLAMLFLLLTIQALSKRDPASVKDSLVMGALTGLTVLARTEYLLFIPIALICILLRSKKERGSFNPAAIAAFIATLGLTCGWFFVYNFITFGHFEQISGLIKSADNVTMWKDWGACYRSYLYYPQVIVNAIYDRPARINLVLSFLILIALFSGKFRSSVNFHRDPRIKMLSGLVALVLGHHMISFGPCQFRDWHAAPAIFLLQLIWIHLLGDLWRFLTGIPKRIFAILICAFLVSAFIQVFYFADHWRKVNYHFVCPRHYRHQATLWIRDNLPQGARIGSWNAGYIGYFSGRSVTNLDGLINGKELYDYLTDGRGVWEYITDNKIQYIADYFWGQPKPEESPIGHRLELVKKFGKCETTKGGKPAYVDFYIWKVNY
jgi:hypothetical protein